jgi:hypothetical protein
VQAIEIRGFRLTPAFPLAYDDSKANEAERADFQTYAILAWASGTVLDRGAVSAGARLDAARILELSYKHKPPERA